MFKKVFLFTFILLFTFMGSVFAHTGLESSTPENGEVIKENLEKITLTFHGKIEQGSTFTVEGNDGASVAVNNIIITNNVMSGDLSSSLENGNYTVNWSIIGEDGHVVEDRFNFTIDAPVQESVTEDNNTQTIDEENGTDDTVSTQINEEATETNQATTNENTEAAQDEGNSNLLFFIVGLLVVIIVISFVFLAKRKR
ncbi:MAG TPA: copper resistance protein CopC [Ureibacillus sp.]|nr:copper resistance protein CopC [Ureibacillus sp.]